MLKGMTIYGAGNANFILQESRIRFETMRFGLGRVGAQVQNPDQFSPALPALVAVETWTETAMRRRTPQPRKASALTQSSAAA